MTLTLPTPRKTFSVDRLVEMTNHYLAHADSTPDGREAAASLLEAVLMESHRYNGFRYLDTDEIEGAGTRRFYFTKEV